MSHEDEKTWRLRQLSIQNLQECAKMESVIADLRTRLAEANARAERAEGENGKLRASVKDCIEKLERYANRQGSKRMIGKSLSQGMRDNSANEGQHYPAVQSCIDIARNALKAASPSSQRSDGERLDWLEKKFALWNQGSILSKMDGDWFCNSGCYQGSTAREAIDAAMDTTSNAKEGGEG